MFFNTNFTHFSKLLGFPASLGLKLLFESLSFSIDIRQEIKTDEKRRRSKRVETLKEKIIQPFNFHNTWLGLRDVRIHSNDEIFNEKRNRRT